MKSTVRQATEADLPRVVELLSQLGPDNPDREGLSTPLSYRYHMVFRQTVGAGQRLFVVEDGGRIAGTLGLVIVPNLSHRGTPYAIIENVVVDEKSRSRGLGETLIRAAIAEAKAAGCYKVSLTSNKRRTEAHRFYERLGFKRTQEAFRIDFD